MPRWNVSQVQSTKRHVGNRSRGGVGVGGGGGADGESAEGGCNAVGCCHHSNQSNFSAVEPTWHQSPICYSCRNNNQVAQG